MLPDGSSEIRSTRLRMSLTSVERRNSPKHLMGRSGRQRPRRTDGSTCLGGPRQSPSDLLPTLQRRKGTSGRTLRESRNDLEQLVQQKHQLDKFRTLRESLSAAAPLFAETVVEGVSDLPEADGLDRAWRWSWAIREIQGLRNASESKLVEQLDKSEAEIANYTTVLCTVRAWRNTLAGLTGYEAQELKAYQQALRRLGRGLGRRAATHRSDAQRHLANCQTAVRAWIMPTYRVAETLRAKQESFDVVIVDEASQSGVDALFLFWLGKQVVIVGDDNRSAPAMSVFAPRT